MKNIKTHQVLKFVVGLSLVLLMGNMLINYLREKNYETMMNKETYAPCASVDEDGVYAKITYWNEDDSELKNFPRDEGTGRYLPIKDYIGRTVKEPPVDYPGQIKHMEIAFLRGYRISDGYGVSGCIPCSKAKNQRQINICNSRHLYLNATIGGIDFKQGNESVEVADIDEAKPELVKDMPNQESDYDIQVQQNRVSDNNIKQIGY